MYMRPFKNQLFTIENRIIREHKPNYDKFQWKMGGRCSCLSGNTLETKNIELLQNSKDTTCYQDVTDLEMYDQPTIMIFSSLPTMNHQCNIIIQSAFRGFLARKLIKKLKSRRKSQSEISPVSKLPLNFRKYDEKIKSGDTSPTIYIVNDDGSEYEGFSRNGMPNGKGKLKLSDGTVYTGNFIDGKRQGYGKLKYHDDGFYEGEFRNDLCDGYGIRKWANGNKYKGYWVGGKMEGQGEYTWEDGRKYIGYFKNDNKHGYGELFWPEGRIYKGNWADGKQDGIGIYTCLDSKNKTSKTVKGLWKNGKRINWLKI
ncbi:unnamed protein product [Blepharisma stoltei]|uniref:MORN repeat protein n=1 Tax=Blepharisma stoltei TaxID=1481888 RepID=A0AAU9IZE4_9CILI|nr:unnamed protein product [Blepharisma stoltei]